VLSAEFADYLVQCESGLVGGRRVGQQAVEPVGRVRSYLVVQRPEAGDHMSDPASQNAEARWMDSSACWRPESPVEQAER